ncbi:MAG: methyl-accepting chemotaxis protein [Desulfovibrio sp.]
MKLTTKLVLSFSSIIFLMLALFGVYYVNTDRIDHAVSHMDQQYVPSLVAVQTMTSLLYSARSDLAALTPHTDKVTIAEYRDRIRRALRQFAHHAEAYQTLMDARKKAGEPVDDELWGNITAQLHEEEATREEIIRLAGEGDTDGSIALFTRSRADFIRLARYFDQLVQHDVQLSQEAAASAQEIARQSRMAGAVLAIVGILFSIAVTAGITLAIKRQLGKDPAQLQLIAGRVAEGDYDLEHSGRQQGVYASLVLMVQALKAHIESARSESEKAREESARANAALQQAEAAERDARAKTEAMQQVAEALEEVTHVVATASGQVGETIRQAEESADSTAQRLTEAATGMEQMNATVGEVAQNATVASDSSAETRQKAEDGAKVVRHALESIETVRSTSLRLKDDMEQLGGHAQAITRIMNVISDIADQTNLLALNAAIEAARAGDAGRGFAVVADEVRKLAEKTMASTHDVDTAIKAIQHSVARSAASVDEAVKGVSVATDAAQQSGQALEGIVGTVEGTASQVSAIAAASEQQAVATNEINRTIGDVTDLSRQTAAAMSAAARAVAGLSAQARNLEGLMEQMRNC